jgi:hypothetical protein
MSALLYYLPGVKAATPDGLKASGLAHLLPCRLPGTETAKGPDNGAGVVFYALPSGQQADLEPPKMDPARQKWFRCAGGKFYCGYWADTPLPGPDDLARERMYPSEPVVLSDGREWKFPIARFVPPINDLDDDGNPVKVAPEAFSRFNEIGNELGRLAAEHHYNDFPLSESLWYELVSEGFGLNYRVSRWELFKVLRLVDDENRQACAWAALNEVDYQAVLASLSVAKNAESPAGTPDGSSSESGAQGD